MSGGAGTGDRGRKRRRDISSITVKAPIHCLMRSSGEYSKH